ncbi:MAG: hypothetical protein AAF363_02920 [Bacteroidota bacterium]
MNKKVIFLLITISLWSCGDDEEDGGGLPSASLSELDGFWTTNTWLTNPSGNAGLLTLEFDATSAAGVISTLSTNEWGFSCGEQTFRSLESVGFNSFAGEGLIRFVDGSSEWVPTTITLVDTDQISIIFDCSGCSNQALAMDRLSTGTPTSVVIDTDINEPVTFFNIVCDPEQADYIVTDLIGIDDLLTIEPGVIIEFAENAGFVVGEFGGGAITATGTAIDPVTFTGQTKTRGFWRGLVFETRDERNELNYVIVEYAGSDVIADDIKDGVSGGIAVNVEPGGEAASLTLTNSTIRENEGYGLIMEWFSELSNFSNNSFENNTEAAVLTEAINVGALDATSGYRGGNGFEGVEIAQTNPGNALRDDATWTNFDDGSSYYVSGDIEIEATLTILPGVRLEFEANTEIFFGVPFGRPEGILIANGTMLDPITFTGVQSVEGFWQGIVIQSTSDQNLMNHCVVEYGGSEAIFGGQPANITLDIFNFAPSLTITNSTIRNSSGCGIFNQGGNLTESDNTFSGNSEGDICDM